MLSNTEMHDCALQRGASEAHRSLMTSTKTTSTLRAALDELSGSLAAQLPADVSGAFAAATLALKRERLADRALTRGAVAPDFTLMDTEGKPWTLSDVAASSSVVLSFVRGGWCPYCSLQLRTLQRELSRLTSLGTLVVISPEIPQHAGATRAKLELAFPVLSDVGCELAHRYGVAFAIPPAVRPVYTALGINVPQANGNDTWELPMPATFIVGSDLRIEDVFVDEDYTRRMEPDAILVRLLQLAEQRR
jgi:peroxiredoxin